MADPGFGGTVCPPPSTAPAQSQVFLPAGLWASVLDFLIERFPHIDASQWQDRLRAGLVSDAQGRPVALQSRYSDHVGQHLRYQRSVLVEQPVPFEAQILFEDDTIVVVDKPHFLPVTPSGRYVRETLLARLQAQLGLPDLAPAHRLDRDTAGVVLFTKQRAVRGAYHGLFSQRLARKVYEAVAPIRADLSLPCSVHNRLVDAPHFMQMMAVDGAPNALTHIEFCSQQQFGHP